MSRENKNLKLTTIIFRTHQYVESVIKKDIQLLGLNTTEFGTLEFLYHQNRQPIQMICQKMLMANSSMTYVIDQLEKKELIKRIPDGVDRRMTYVELTTNGRLFFESIFPKHVQKLELIYQHLSDEEVHTLKELLKKVGYQAKNILEG